MNFGTRLKELRTKHDETQLQISQLLGTAKSNISKYESNSVEPSISMLTTLAKHFKVSVDYLLCLTDEPCSKKNETNNEKFVSARLQNLINEDNLDYDFYSHILKIPKDIFRMYVNGTKQPSIYDLCKIIETFDTTADYLFGNTDDAHPKATTNHYISNDSFPHILNIEMENNNYLKIELSNELDISMSKIEKLLSGEELPSPNILYKIAQVLKKSTDYLLGLSKTGRAPDENGNFPYEVNKISLERLQELLEKDTDTYMSSKLGLTEDEYFNLYHYGFIPHISVINRLCKIFNISADYLLGISESKLTIIYDKENNEDSLIKSYRLLDNPYKKDVDGYISRQILQQKRDSYMRESVAADEELRKTGTTNSVK